MRNKIITGDALEVLRTMPDEYIQCIVTSPPYFGLRDYGTAQWEGGSAECDHKATRIASPKMSNVDIIPTTKGDCPKCGATRIDQQIGLEETPEQYIEKLVAIFREAKRVLRHDGTLWCNIGDSYAAGGGADYQRLDELGERMGTGGGKKHSSRKSGRAPIPAGLKPKDLIGIPWLLAKALQNPYYIGKIASELDRVWLAATIDAEGCICGFTHERKDDGTIRTGVEITITNSSIALLDNAQRIWPTTRVDHNFHGQGHLGGADTYRWIAHNVDEKSILLSEIYPYLIVKKKQALLAWNFLEMSKQAKRLARTPEAEEVKIKREWIINALSSLNHFGDVDIPGWCKEPPSLYEPGYYLRSDIIWAKSNCMPESVTDRPTKSHEYLFLLSKSERYFYDAQAIAEPLKASSIERDKYARNDRYMDVADGKGYRGSYGGKPDGPKCNPAGRNKRSVWTVPTSPYSEAHFAVFPPKLIEPCILAGTSPRACEVCGAPWERVVDRVLTTPGVTGGRTPYDANRPDGMTLRAGGFGGGSVSTIGWQPTCTCANNTGSGKCVILDPFMGAGTVALVAIQHQRDYLGIELNPEYVKLIEKRIAYVQQNLWSRESEWAV